MPTFTQRQIRNEKKREKTALKRYKETKDVSYMRKADECKEKWMDLERNQQVEQRKNKDKIMKKNMTEEEAFQEAEEYNRKMFNEGEKKAILQMEKEANIKEIRMNAKLFLKEKKEKQKKILEKKQSLKNNFMIEQENQKIKFFQKMKGEHPTMSDAYLQKKFRRYQFDREKREEYKEKMKIVFSLNGVEENCLNQEIEKYFDYLREQKENDHDFPLDFELDDYLEGYTQMMIETKVSDLEEPISEKEVETHSSL